MLRVFSLSEHAPQYKALSDARGKSAASNSSKKPNAIEQQKQQQKEVQALVKQQQTDAKARRHEGEEDRKKAIKSERCARAACILFWHKGVRHVAEQDESRAPCVQRYRSEEESLPSIDGQRPC